MKGKRQEERCWTYGEGVRGHHDTLRAVVGRNNPRERRRAVGEQRSHRTRSGVNEDMLFAFRDREGRGAERRREAESRRSWIWTRQQRRPSAQENWTTPSPAKRSKNIIAGFSSEARMGR